MRNRKLAVPKALVKAAIEALEYKARNEAAQSQEPYLFKAEETTEWISAQHLRRILKNKEYV